MIKKVFVGVLLAGVFGLLVFGAVNRTLAKTSESVSHQSESSLVGTNSGTNGSGNNGGNGGGQDGSGNNASAATPLNKNLNKNESRADGSGSQAGDDCDTRGGRNATSNETTSSGNLNGRGQGNGQSESTSADGAGIGLAEVDEWITQAGTVESVDDELLVVNLTDGTTLEIEGRTLSYALELGLSLNAGDELELTGFMEDDDFEVGQIENITTGQVVVVRAETGRPLWAGGGH